MSSVAERGPIIDTPWHISLFGGLCARQEDRVITRFATAKNAALLAYLALYPKRLHSREELADLFWPDSDLEAGRGSLRTALASLRRQLEPPGIPSGSVLVTDTFHIRLNPQAVCIDVSAFESALKSAAKAASPADRQAWFRQALELYIGELLPGFYDDWALTERERLARLYEDALAKETLPDTAQEEQEPAASSPALPETAAPRLPLQWTRLFGREQERAEISPLLAWHRLVTLTGLGGTGKTRLAVASARDAAPLFGSALFFVPLADLNAARHIPGAICRTLRLTETGQKVPLEQAVQALCELPRALLVLDNMEHLAEEGAAVVLALLTRVPSLTCLVTSRRRLALPGEREFAVPALPVPSLPTSQDEPDLETLAQCASVQLFVDRTQAIRPDFQLTRRNALSVAGLCADLEGIPLALELAAARAQTLTPAQIRTHLHQRFEMLTTRQTDKDARHRSLWATIAWSVDLLPPELRRFWACLSIFRGGGTTEAASAVTGDPKALERWTQLRERSLVLAEDGAAEMRFRLLESLRAFGWEQMDSEERETASRRHAHFFLSLAQASEPKLRGAEQETCLAQLEEDHDNFRAALDWAEAHDPELSLRLASALSFFWSIRGYLREGRERLEHALSGAGQVDPVVRSKALHSLGVLAYWQSDYPAAGACYAEALALRRVSGERTDLLKTLQNLAAIHAYQGDNDGAKALYEESLEVCRQESGGVLAMPALLGLAIIAQWQGEREQARHYYEETLRIVQASGDRRSEATVLFNLGELMRGQGEASAAALHEQSLALARALGDRTGMARALISLGYLAAAQHFSEKARSLLEEALALCREIGDPDGIANTLVGFGDIACAEQDWSAAQTAYAESLTIQQGLGDERLITGSLHRLGILAVRQGQPTRGAHLLAAAQARREYSLHQLSPLAQAEWETTLLALQAALLPTDLDAAFAAGRTLPAEATIALALTPTPSPKHKKKPR